MKVNHGDLIQIQRANTIARTRTYLHGMLGCVIGVNSSVVTVQIINTPDGRLHWMESIVNVHHDEVMVVISRYLTLQDGP
jgi:hypothetical protein